MTTQKNMPEMRPVPGWEHYAVDKAGNVYSLPRTIDLVRSGTPVQRRIPLRKLNPKPGASGYKQLYLHRDGKRVSVSVHRMMAAAFLGINLSDSSVHVDHANHDKLDNRIENLRKASRSQNKANASGVRVDNTSGYNGVYLDGSKWRARIWVKNEQIRLGTFDCPIEAAHAYDAAARKHFGEFAFQNFQNGKEAA